VVGLAHDVRVVVACESREGVAMPPKATGSVETFRRADGTKYYRARIRLSDGTRERVDIPEKYAYSEERREAYAAAVQEREDESGELLAKKRERVAARAKANDPTRLETCTKYRERLNAYRTEIGKSIGDPSAWRVWINKHIGSLPIATVRREEIERFRDLLDLEIAKYQKSDGAEGVSPKRAMNVWTEVTTTFAEATEAKRADLRVREDNPCKSIKPPESGDSREKTDIYPREMTAVLRCLDVALEWREAFAVGSYLYLRPGELHALTWGDVDMDAAVVHVTKAYDVRSKRLKAPKTKQGRRTVPIPAALVPLLQRMRMRGDGSRRDDTELVAPIVAGTPESKRAPRFVAALRAAGCTRARLFENTATTMAVNFRSLRDSGITWLSMTGVGVVQMQRRAGHDDVNTTLGYVKRAEDLSGGDLGEPFGPIPAATLDGHMGQGDVPPKSMGRRPRYQPKYQPNCLGATVGPLKLSAEMVEAAGVEPPQVVENTRFVDVSRPPVTPRDNVSTRSVVTPGPNNNEVMSAERGVSEETRRSPRRALMDALARATVDAALDGDQEAARVAHEALGKLVASSATRPSNVTPLRPRKP
jgi:integrase